MFLFFVFYDGKVKKLISCTSFHFFWYIICHGMFVIYPSCLWSAGALSLIFWKMSHETGVVGCRELAEITLKLKPAWCLAEEAPGSVIISQLNLVCVYRDSLRVCMLCHVARCRSGFKGGHRSGQGRTKAWTSCVTHRQVIHRETEMDVWYFGIRSLHDTIRTPRQKSKTGKKIERGRGELLELLLDASAGTCTCRMRWYV